MTKAQETKKEQAMKPGRANILIVGCGGGGGNAINRMKQNNVVNNVKYVAINTDAQVLETSKADIKVQIGTKITRGLGAGANPEVGKKAAEESKDEIKKALTGADMVFLTVGLGGGTGTGAAPVVAEIAKKELDILTTVLATLPFRHEGKKRTKQAYEGRDKLFEIGVDTLVTIPNDRIYDEVSKDRDLTMIEALIEVDKVVEQAARGVVELIDDEGVVNLDFSDVKTVLEIGGSAIMGIGISKGDDAPKKALEDAMKNPLLLHEIDGAKGVILNFTGGSKLSFKKIVEAADLVADRADPDANIIYGNVIKDDNEWEDRVQVTLIATGFDTHIENTERGVRKVKERREENIEILKDHSQAKEKKSFEEPVINRTTSNHEETTSGSLGSASDELEVPKYFSANLHKWLQGE